MAAPLSRVYANVITPTVRHIGVSLQIPPGRSTALVRRGRELIAEVAGVTEVRNVGGGQWQVTFEDGAIWDVTDARQPCGC